MQSFFFLLASKEIKKKMHNYILVKSSVMTDWGQLYESTKMRMLGQGKTGSYFFRLFLF